MRFELIRDFRDPVIGYYHKQGQTGTILRQFTGQILVEFDGFEEEKRQAQEFKTKYGEWPNLLLYRALLPPSLIALK